ncbi:MAG: hypothetical protein AAF226_09840, partial [Verrucomicrobiota bacterium]
SLIEKKSKPSILDKQPLDIEIPQRVYCSNDLSDDGTVIEVQAKDRLGLLFDIFFVLQTLGVEVISSRVSTQAGAAIDRFQIVEPATGEKVKDPDKLKMIEQQVKACLDLAPRSV